MVLTKVAKFVKVLTGEISMRQRDEFDNLGLCILDAMRKKRFTYRRLAIELGTYVAAVQRLISGSHGKRARVVAALLTKVAHHLDLDLDECQRLLAERYSKQCSENVRELSELFGTLRFDSHVSAGTLKVISVAAESLPMQRITIRTLFALLRDAQEDKLS